MPASCTSPRTASSSRPGVTLAPARASSRPRTCWPWTRWDGCSWPTAATPASRSSTRTAVTWPSGVYINKNDDIYVSDSTSTEKTNPGFMQGIRVGTVKDGKVTAFIPETAELSALEGVAADDAGNIYGGYTNTPNFTKGGPPEVNFRRWVKKGANF